MKKTTLFTIGLVLSLGICHAQENETVVEETTVKRVVKKDGNTVEVKEMESTTAEKGKLVQKESNKEDADYSEVTQVVKSDATVVDKQLEDEKNKALKEAQLKKQEEELQKSREAGLAKAEAERKILEQQQAERLKALEENRKQLEKRGKGVSKLKKKKGN